MKRKVVFLGLILALVALPLTACAQPAPAPAPAPPPAPAPSPSPAPAPEKVTLNFYGGKPGGTSHPIAVAMIKVWEDTVPGVSISLVPTGGGTSSIMAIEEQKADIAVGVGASVGEALLGAPPFEKKAVRLSSFVSLFPLIYTTTVWKDSDIETYADLNGKDLNPAVKGYTAEVIIRRLLEIEGLSYDDMASVQFAAEQEGAALLKDGHVDAIVDFGSGENDTTLIELSVQRPIRILPIPDDMLAKLQENEPGLVRWNIPAGGLNGLDEDCPTVAQSYGFICDSSLPEDLVYKLTKALAEKWGDVKPVSARLERIEAQDLAMEVGVDFHPGAAKYYKEMGWIK